jgi:hypothetical protein
MPRLIELKTFSDKRGNLSVFEDYEIPFAIRRVFYIYNLDASKRAGHRHKKTQQALLCLNGSCKIDVDNNIEKYSYFLNHPKKCLLLAPEDWHILYDFEPQTIVLVCASEYFDESDYIFEKYKDN